MDKIKISKDLRDYIELLHYEQIRYNDFMRMIYRDICPMTDEEWESSLEYFTNLRDEAVMSYQAMIESIAEIYAEQIDGREWFVDFIDCAIKFYPDKPAKVTIDNREQYHEQLNRLFPVQEEFNMANMKINNYSAKDITL